jgi:decaprenylphospho-beta-D-erythro-pentofuranosid-2-ulose 2-reductase
MKNIFIFGATSAIAQATIRLFAQEEVHLYLIARHEEKLRAVTADLRVRYPSLLLSSFVVDLADVESHAALFAAIQTAAQTIDLAFITYGSNSDQAACQSSYMQAEAALRTNLLSVISLLTHLANIMEAKHHGTIAVITSVAGDRGRQSNYVYGTAKGALNVFLQGLRNRLYPQGVHVITIKPGFVDTPMTKDYKKNALWAQPEQVARQIKKGIDKQRNTIYVPSFWLGVMTAIKLIPEELFKRMRL